MNITKPNKTRVCPCGAQFEPTARNQRYCQRCREARAEAMEVLKNNVCHRCQQEKESLRSGICAECREAEAQRKSELYAARIARINANGGCKKCGGTVTNLHIGEQLCDACNSKRVEELRQERKRRQREKDEQVGAERKANPPVPPRDDSDNDDESGLSAFVALLRLFFGDDPAPKKDAPIVEEVSPEQIAHADQAAIDAAFVQLMEGIEL